VLCPARGGGGHGSEHEGTMRSSGSRWCACCRRDIAVPNTFSDTATPRQTRPIAASPLRAAIAAE